jgi:hypothetical protein
MQIERPTLTFTRPAAVGLRRGASVAIAALACAALASGCGSSNSSTSSSAPNLDTRRVALSIEQTLFEKRHLHSTVVCPAAVPQEKGRTFECIATIRATKPPHAVSKSPFAVTIQSDRGYVTYVGK